MRYNRVYTLDEQLREIMKKYPDGFDNEPRFRIQEGLSREEMRQFIIDCANGDSK
jgi:hypothetical protein